MCQALKLYFLDASRQSYNTDDRKIEKRLWGQRSHAWSSTAGSPSKPLSPGQLPLYSRGIPGKAQNHLGPGSLICRKRVIGTPVTWGFGWRVCARKSFILYFIRLERRDDTVERTGLQDQPRDSTSSRFKRNSDRVAPYLNTGLLRLNWASQVAKKIRPPKQKLQAMWV